MSDVSPPSTGSGSRLWLAIGAVAVLGLILIVGKFGGFFDPEQLGRSLGDAVRGFAEGPFGVPVLILVFCVCAFIAVPQFVLIGVAVFAFGPVWGAIWAWAATMVSGSFTFWLGRFFGEATLQRLGEGRIKRFADFVARNAFAASAIVRNVPTGPFLMVNMVFGAVRSNFLHYLAGMGLGVMPKIALVAFGLQAIQAALAGNIWMAVAAAAAALMVFLGGFLYVRHRRRKGENIALNVE